MSQAQAINKIQGFSSMTPDYLGWVREIRGMLATHYSRPSFLTGREPDLRRAWLEGLQPEEINLDEYSPTKVRQQYLQSVGRG